VYETEFNQLINRVISSDKAHKTKNKTNTKRKQTTKTTPKKAILKEYKIDYRNNGTKQISKFSFEYRIRK